MTDADFGEHLAEITKNSVAERDEKERKRKRDQRDQEELVALGRTVSMEDLKQKCYTDLKLHLKMEATKGNYGCKVTMDSRLVIDEQPYTLFDWEKKEIAAWIQAKFAEMKGLRVKRAGTVLYFDWWWGGVETK